ncbi:MAG: hypothetical protein IH852_03810 [Bacteroidetes bacterium]|nr:hypothetical protein [Bacteroidota bacterium]
MNSLFKLLSFILAGLLFVYSCTEENSTNPPGEENLPVYFPNSEGTFYKYEIIQTDTNGVASMGIRDVVYLEDTLINSTRYKLQIDSIQTNLQLSVSSSYFRTTETGVFYFVDTTGFTNTLPDSLQSSVELQDELRAYLFPLSEGTFWTVYRISIEVNEFLSFNLVNITGKYISDETLILDISDGTQTINTKKVEIVFKLQTGAADSVITFNANTWLTEDIGIVKMEGSAVVLSLFSGGGLNLSDTSIIVTQNLIDYDVK